MCLTANAVARNHARAVSVRTGAYVMRWWYKIRDASGKLMETRRGFPSQKEARDAGERAARREHVGAVPREVDSRL